MSKTESITVAKVCAMQYIVSHLQLFGEANKEKSFDDLRRQTHLLLHPLTRNEAEECLGHPTKRSQLSRIAFPSANHYDVALVPEAGSTIDALYALARGGEFLIDDVPLRAHVLRDPNGQPLKAKHGLRIVWRAVELPKQRRNQIVEHFRKKLPHGSNVPSRVA